MFSPDSLSCVGTDWVGWVETGHGIKTVVNREVRGRGVWGTNERQEIDGWDAGWHHRLDGHEFEKIPGAGDEQGGLTCCDSWGRKELDTAERLNWTELRYWVRWKEGDGTESRWGRVVVVANDRTVMWCWTWVANVGQITGLVDEKTGSMRLGLWDDYQKGWWSCQELRQEQSWREWQ